MLKENPSLHGGSPAVSDETAGERGRRLRREEREREELRDHHVIVATFWFQTICCGCSLAATLLSNTPDWSAMIIPVGGQSICLYYIHQYVKGVRKP